MAVVYFLSYIMLLTWIVINVYIAVMLENFRQAQDQESIGITEDGIEAFYEVWQKFDPLPTQFIRVEQLESFVGDLEQPFDLSKTEYEEMMIKCDIPVKEEERFHCLDILSALVKFRLGERRCTESEDMKKVLEKVEKIFAIKFPARKHVATIDSTLKRHQVRVNAAQTVQRLFRYYCFVTYTKKLTRMARYNRNPNRYMIRDMMANLVVPSQLYDKEGKKRVRSIQRQESRHNVVFRNHFASQ